MLVVPGSGVVGGVGPVVVGGVAKNVSDDCHHTGIPSPNILNADDVVEYTVVLSSVPLTSVETYCAPLNEGNLKERVALALGSSDLH